LGLFGATGTPGASGAAGATGPIKVSTDIQNQSKLGSDSKIYAPPKIGKYRYYYCWHCDHPASTNQNVVANGAGSSVGSIAPVDAYHPGQYNLVTGANLATAYAYYASSTVADIQLGFFSKLAFRCVVKANTLAWGATAATGGVAIFGLTDSLTANPTNGIVLFYDSTALGTGTWYLRTYNGGASSQIAIYQNPPLARSLEGDAPLERSLSSGTWSDIAIYWDSSGAKGRFDIWNGVSLPSLSSTITTNIPPLTTNLFWEIAIRSTGASSPSSSCAVDLVEICGEYAPPGGYRGEDLVTAF
jgi:hypothetical protein